MIKEGLINKKQKKAQMHFPFQLIFSLILIAVFLVVAFFVIRHFLSLKDCSEIGLFVRELQDAVDDVWQAQEASTSVELNLPSSLKYVCFVNLSMGKNLVGLSAEEREIVGEIYDDLRVYFKYKPANFFLYPWQSACNMADHSIEHVNLANMSNPYCFENVKGKIKISLGKSFDEALVRVS